MRSVALALLALLPWVPAALVFADEGPEPARRPEFAIVARLEGHGGLARCLAFAPDGGLLATGGSDRSLRFWDVAARMEMRKHVLPPSG